MEVGTQAMEHLINILQTDRYVEVKAIDGSHQKEPRYNSYQEWWLNFISLLLFFYFKSTRSDSEILGYALDTLYNLISNDEEEEQGMKPQLSL